MAKQTPRSIAAQNRRLTRENAVIKGKSSAIEGALHNSLNGLATGLTGDFGGRMSNLTSFNPTLQNNQYAPITLMWTDLMYMYTTHGLLQTAVDMPVMDALRGGLDIQSDQLDAEDIGVLEDWLEENAVLERIGDAFIWARLFGGGALVINTEGDCEDPIGDELMGGQVELYDACRWELTCERRIPRSGKYGFYGKQLDASRVITILGKRAPWLVRAQLGDWGMSELQRVIEDFNLFLRTRNVLYEILEEAKVDVYSLKGFSAQLASSTGTALTVKRIQTMNQIKNFNNALILDKEDGYDVKNVAFSGLAEIMKENRMGIASAFRMPMSKLFGIPSTGFSSGEDDIENYNGLVESEVRAPMRQVVRKVLKIAVKHLFHDDLDVRFSFKPLRTLSGTDEETIKTSKTNRYVALFDKMLMDSREIGEAMQKDGLVPVPLKAEKGLLDDHPAPDNNALMAPQAGDPGKPATEVESEGAMPTGEPPLKLPSAGQGATPEKPAKPDVPEKPKVNAMKRRTT